MSFFEPGRIRVKICGLTNEEDAKMSVAAGADALGFNFYPGSKRCIALEDCAWISRLEGKVDRIAVVVNPDEDLLSRLREAECFEAIQFHGDESPSFCEWAGFARWIKAIRTKNEEALHHAVDFNSPHVLLDAWTEGEYGGTGKRLDWDMAHDFIRHMPERRFILAGGLNAHNVRNALRIARPHAVDVAGGVELHPGKKEEYLVREFIKAARSLSH